MNVGSLFSGIGGMDAGLARAGFKHSFFCEIDEWRRSILAARFPGVAIYDDVRTVGLRESAEGASLGGLRAMGGDADESDSGRGGPSGTDGDNRLDVLVGGFPCQDLSVAGKRAGLAGERSGLFFELARIAGALVKPGGYLLSENVPGLLSSNGGRDFHVVLETLADLGFHDLAWRVLDSKFFGVPQRRRRVFILARRARGVRCAQVLLESEGGGGRTPARDEEKQEVAGTLGGGAGSRGWCPGTDRMTFVPAYWDGGQTSDTLDVSMLTKGQMMPEKRRFPVVMVPGARRLTPTECERLQGLPDGWTLPGSDTKRYAGLGDAVTANVAEWIGRRILAA